MNSGFEPQNPQARLDPLAPLAAAQVDWLQDLPAPWPDLSAGQTLQWLQAASEAGWLRRLDSALAAQLQRLDPATSAPVLVAAALLVHMEGRGHTCLALHDLASAPVALLGWSAEAVQSPQGLLALWAHMPTDVAAWQRALQGAPQLGTALARRARRGPALGLGRYIGCAFALLAPLQRL